MEDNKIEQEQTEKVIETFSKPEVRRHSLIDMDRTLKTYLGLFPDDKQEGLDREVFIHYTMGKILYLPRLLKKRVILTESLFGGKEEFFREGSNLLDIGSGGGTAVAEISQSYPKVNVVGLDIRYGIHPPVRREKIPQGSHNISQYVTGTWEHFPFADNSFDRITSVYTIPTYLYEGYSKGEIQNILDEITRLAKNGTLWRGTYNTPTGVHPELFRDLLKRGWDSYTYGRGTLIARLHKIQK